MTEQETATMTSTPIPQEQVVTDADMRVMLAEALKDVLQSRAKMGDAQKRMDQLKVEHREAQVEHRFAQERLTAIFEVVADKSEAREHLINSCAELARGKAGLQGGAYCTGDG